MEHHTSTATLIQPPTMPDATAIVAPPSPASPRPSAVPVEVPTADLFYRLTVEQYHAMIGANILGEDDPVELLDGWLIRKISKYSPHTTAARLAGVVIPPLLPHGWFMIFQDPITLAESEPEPDAVVVRGGFLDYSKRHPGPEEVALIIEVAESSLAGDRTWKMRIYARAGILHYWIINLNDRVIEVHSDPIPGTAEYRVRTIHAEGERIPLMIDGRAVAEVAAADLLP